jgi:amidase
MEVAMTDELWRKTAIELAEGIRRGDYTSREVVESHLARIEATNARVNAVVAVSPESALAEADAADAARGREGELGALHGVPFTVKTNLDVKGGATTEAVRALEHVIAPSDSPMVAKMREAGAVVLARTNMPDFGLRINSESELYGATHNPWNHVLTAGGSSGGEAAAIAAGMSPIGLGNDIGGSLRNPAYACGIASIKPSFGRVAHANDSAPIDPMLASQLMMVNGVMARTVADVRRGLVAVMGSDPRDPHAVDSPLEGPPRPKRAAFVAEPPGEPTHPDVAEGVRVAAKALEAEGFEVEEVSPPGIVDAYVNWAELMYSGLHTLRPLLDNFMGEDGRRFLEFTDLEFPPETAATAAAMHQARHRIHKGFQQFFAEFPVLVGPVWTQPPFPLGWDIESKENAVEVLHMFRFVLPANLMGLPAACVATGVANGVPTGVQVMGSRMREDLCLDAAEAIERQVGVLTPIDPR